MELLCQNPRDFVHKLVHSQYIESSENLWSDREPPNAIDCPQDWTVKLPLSSWIYAGSEVEVLVSIRCFPARGFYEKKTKRWNRVQWKQVTEQPHYNTVVYSKNSVKSWLPLPVLPVYKILYIITLFCYNFFTKDSKISVITRFQCIWLLLKDFVCLISAWIESATIHCNWLLLLLQQTKSLVLWNWIRFNDLRFIFIFVYSSTSSTFQNLINNGAKKWKNYRHKNFNSNHRMKLAGLSPGARS